jgi:hypothetical protein
VQLHRDAAEAAVVSAYRTALMAEKKAKESHARLTAAAQKKRRLKVESQFAGREEGWDANLRQQEFKREQEARQQGTLKKQKRVRNSDVPAPLR